jgi:murein DD-endopeptidase MepM/ murein hydrolase activator NlpD
MLIPDANRRIAQWKIPVIALYIVPCALVLAVAVASFAVYSRFQQIQVDRAAMENRLSVQINRLQQSQDEKKDRITELQNQLIDLSSQADQFKESLDRVKELESELGDIANTSDALSGLQLSALDGAGGQAAQEQIGGEALPVTERSVDLLADDTRNNFNQLSSELESSISNISTYEQIILEKQHQARITPSIWPTISHLITSRFGVRRDPFTSSPTFHSGLDIAGKLGDPVYATAEGTVTFVGYDGTHGNHILIDHSGGIVTHYMHLSRILVGKGDEVSKGDKIGLLGSTGRSTGPHVHYEVLKRNQPVDPTPFLKG